MTGLVKNQAITELLPKGYKLTVTADAAGSALVERFYGGVLQDKTVVGNSAIVVLGEYFDDMTFRITCNTSNITFTIDQTIARVNQSIQTFSLANQLAQTARTGTNSAVASATFTSNAGTALVSGVFQGIATATGTYSFNIQIDGSTVHTVSCDFNQTVGSQQVAFTFLTTLLAGAHTLTILNAGTGMDSLITDTADITVLVVS